MAAMKNPTFICPRCDKMRGRNEMVEVRVEHRMADTQQRRFTVCVEKVCRHCADIEAEHLRPTRVPNIAAPEQASLLTTGGNA